MVRDVLFRRTLAEVLEGRNLRVIFEDAEKLELVSVMVLFETFEPIPLNGEIVVNGVIIDSEYVPYWCESCNTVMVPLEVVAIALGLEMGSGDSVTFVPLNFFRSVLGQTVYVFEGQVVVETYSDMM